MEVGLKILGLYFLNASRAIFLKPFIYLVIRFLLLQRLAGHLAFNEVGEAANTFASVIIIGP
jgi:hypothetical protein